MTSPPLEPTDASDAVARFFGAIEYRFVRGPFFADLTVTHDRLDLNPRFVRTFRGCTALKSDVQLVTVAGFFSRGVRFETRSGSMDRLIFVPYSPRDRRLLRDELKRQGYPVAD